MAAGDARFHKRIEYKFTGPLAEAIKKYGRDAARVVLAKHMRPYLQLSVELVARTAADKAPKNFSILANSFIANIVLKDLTAATGTPHLYGLVQEEGRRAKHPGRRGIEALTLWAKRKFSVDDKRARQIAFAVAWNLARNPMPGKHYLRDTINEQKPRVQQFLETGAKAAMRELGAKI